jgi:2-polyprenyl-3-methyl-5-hydroxy-6-metoxy-1,4-benzoquinol methylase
MGSDRIPYDRHYFENIFSRQVHNSQRNRHRLTLARQQVGAGSLLEIGCGQGEFLRMAAPFFNVEGIDISPHAVSKLRSTVRIPVRRADIQNTSLPTENYQGIAAFNILEHLHRPGEVVKEIYSALKPGGVLFGSVPYNSHVFGRIHTILSNIFDRTHVATYAPTRWCNIFSGSGFSSIDFFGEVMTGKNGCMYVRGRGWSWLAFNLMFVCKK